LVSALYRAAIINGVTSFIIGFSTIMARYMTLERVPETITRFVLDLTDNKIVVLLLINVMLLLIGMVIDIIPALIILSPILLNVVTPYGLDPVHFGVIMVVNLGIGFITPPYGSTLFIASAISKVPVERMFGYGLLFAVVIFLMLQPITYIPFLSLVFLGRGF
jgi:C4-dicarboxylate transporter DctM subunit